MEYTYIELDKTIQKEIKFKKDSQKLKEIISNVFEVDIMNTSRLSKVVDSRRVFLKILYDFGYTLSAIGKEVNRDHATMHYYKRNDHLFDYDANLRHKYIQCREAFFEGMEAIEKNQIERLILDKYSIVKLQQKYKRLSRIIDLIDRVTYDGKEELMEERVKNMINKYYYGETQE